MAKYELPTRERFGQSRLEPLKGPLTFGGVDWAAARAARRSNISNISELSLISIGFFGKIENKRKLEKEYRFDNYIKPEIKRLAKKFGKLYGKENYDEEIEKWLTL